MTWTTFITAVCVAVICLSVMNRREEVNVTRLAVVCAMKGDRLK